MMIRKHVEDSGAGRHAADIDDAPSIRGHFPLMAVLISELLCGAALVIAWFYA